MRGGDKPTPQQQIRSAILHIDEVERARNKTMNSIALAAEAKQTETKEVKQKATKGSRTDARTLMARKSREEQMARALLGHEQEGEGDAIETECGGQSLSNGVLVERRADGSFGPLDLDDEDEEDRAAAEEMEKRKGMTQLDVLLARDRDRKNHVFFRAGIKPPPQGQSAHATH
mmetsp:Transcript_9785/g.26017  ORF Transcript_9785/g.26017 Transcript_9785/m.26017 type:complete len:174 (+) Transcript_9785:298-819(+)